MTGERSFVLQAVVDEGGKTFKYAIDAAGCGSALLQLTWHKKRKRLDCGPQMAPTGDALPDNVAADQIKAMR
jgi:hypothetical protein